MTKDEALAQAQSRANANGMTYTVAAFERGKWLPITLLSAKVNGITVKPSDIRSPNSPPA